MNPSWIIFGVLAFLILILLGRFIKEDLAYKKWAREHPIEAMQKENTRKEATEEAKRVRQMLKEARSWPNE